MNFSPSRLIRYSGKRGRIYLFRDICTGYYGLKNRCVPLLSGLHFFQERVLILLPQRVEFVFISNTSIWHLCAEMSEQVIDFLLVASCIQGESRGDVDFLSAAGVNADEMEFCSLIHMEEFIHPHHFVPSSRLQSREGADQQPGGCNDDPFGFGGHRHHFLV